MNLSHLRGGRWVIEQIIPCSLYLFFRSSIVPSCNAQSGVNSVDYLLLNVTDSTLKWHCLVSRYESVRVAVANDALMILLNSRIRDFCHNNPPFLALMSVHLESQGANAPHQICLC